VTLSIGPSARTLSVTVLGAATDGGVATSAFTSRRTRAAAATPDDDTTALVAPRLVQAKPEQPRLVLSADRGLLSRDGAELFLHDNVVLLREPLAESAEARMQSSFLHVLRGRALVRTDREVRFTERGRTLVGLGMEYDNEARRLELQARVRGVFEAEVQQ
jgi:LPS export ABC transporter protein LptC